MDYDTKRKELWLARSAFVPFTIRLNRILRRNDWRASTVVRKVGESTDGPDSVSAPQNCERMNGPVNGEIGSVAMRTW